MTQEKITRLQDFLVALREEIGKGAVSLHIDGESAVLQVHDDQGTLLLEDLTFAMDYVSAEEVVIYADYVKEAEQTADVIFLF